MKEYRADDYIQELTPGMRGYSRYRYRVLGRNGYPTHHTHSYSDALNWFNACVELWETEGKKD